MSKEEEVESTAGGEDVEQPEDDKIINLKVLAVIKEAQQKHGLRHQDYQRYRGYCSR